MKHPVLVLLAILFVISAAAQDHYERFERIDVNHYTFELHLNDSTNRISGETTVEFTALKPLKEITLDLVALKEDNKGMSVHSIKSENSTLSFLQDKEQLIIHFKDTIHTDEAAQVAISYSGIPADGLVISKNAHGDRTFFGDNWPNRARHWLPTVDHPSDKATLEFKIYAPAHYDVVANGYLQDQELLSNNLEFTHWKTDVPISTKLMVIGVADFAVGNDSTFNSIPVNSWVFEKDKEKGFENYRYGTKALEYFAGLIGPYSYEKLSHVQSKTRYGGMENASCIFYHERTATSNRSQERLFAHEVAHQWFGNSVTEQDWHHVWLSEGFATYLTHLCQEHFYGEEKLQEGLKSDRERVLNYAKRNLAPVIDTSITEYTHLLNANSYQKASWVLHMLRQDLGDFFFFEGLRRFYADYRNYTALSIDFQLIMESVSGQDLNQFFEQWLWRAGHPVLQITWETTDRGTNINILQVQDGGIYEFQLDLKILFEDGTSQKTSSWLLGEGMVLSVGKKNIKKIIIDPNTRLLFEEQRANN